MNRSLVLGVAASLLFAGFVWFIQEGAYQRGHSTAQAKGDKALADLREEHQKLRADAAEQNLVLYRQQVERANQAELVFLDAQDEIGRLKQQLTQERINRVSTQYTPARGAAPVAAPLRWQLGQAAGLQRSAWWHCPMFIRLPCLRRLSRSGLARPRL